MNAEQRTWQTPNELMATSTTSPSAHAGPVETPTVRPGKPSWAPRIWEGIDFFAWIRLLIHNRLAVYWLYWYIAIIVTFVSLGHTLLRFLQALVYSGRVRRTEIKQAPIFILGHWRTGTTLLHELLVLDQRHGYPTTYECLEPNHFLLTENVITRWMPFLVPSRRPMDNMAAGFDRPQEDEFALCMLGLPSPYLTIAFPNRPPQGQDYLDLGQVSEGKLRKWKQKFLTYLKQLTYRHRRRLVLKSPPHSARIPIFKDMFPEAIFVHIVRDPYVVFPSTLKLWRTLYSLHGLQKPTFAGLEEQVLNTFVRLYDRLEEGKKLLSPGQFYELRYEDLVRDPIREMEKLYDHFKLGDFDKVLPRLRDYLARTEGYETNQYELTPQQRQEVTRHWEKVIRRYGYDLAEQLEESVSR
jgi:omega-hydroxy-beta-dihydromenaquinone-9 sulfotransferase